MLQLTTEDGRTTVTLTASRLDAALAPFLKTAFEERLAEMAAEVRLDLRHVAFVDSAGLGALVRCRKLCRPGRRLALAGLSPTVARVLRLTRMDRVLDVLDDHPA